MKSVDVWCLDKKRKGVCPSYQYFYRKLSSAGWLMRPLYRRLYNLTCFMYHIDIPSSVRIGEGLYIGHPYGITINRDAVLGRNVNIHKGVTIGQENRGSRKGTPTIGNEVWIGINSTIVGKITVGDDVLIAPNTFVNCDVPSHSVVFGNPCKIVHKENATEGYINNKV